MKLVLFRNSLGFDVQLQAVYLTRKKTPFWLYFYNFENRVFQRIENYKASEPLDDDTVLIALEDKGDFFGWSYNDFKDVPNSYFPENDELRYDEDFIGFVEEFQEELVDIMEVIEIPKGEKYRITEIVDSNCWEILELEKDVKWSIAD